MVSYTEGNLGVPIDMGSTSAYDDILTDRDLYTGLNDTVNLTVGSSTDVTIDDRTVFDDMSTFFNFDCEFNLTLCVNSTNSTTPAEYKFWSLVLVVFPFLTVFGNILVVMSVYRERSLRTVTNYFICSLAIADILVAVLVMPLAVYYEVLGYWGLSDELCDAWVASDVMSCTASILNLTAISVDRFIAVTQPIKYSKHKNSKRVFIMLALTWVISIAIAAPIALGVNYSDQRRENDCAFFNADFLIYSSMGSFYIPSLMMLFLYWRIYRVLQLRARKMMGKGKNLDKKTIKNVVENTAVTGSMATVTTPLSTMDNGRLNPNANTFNKRENCIMEEPSMTNVNTGSSSQDPEDDSAERSFDQHPHNHQSEVLIVNPHARDDFNGEPDLKNQAETQFLSDSSSKKSNAGSSKRKFPGLKKDGSGKKKTASTKKGGKFHFHMRASRKRKEKTSSRKERKATKTLAIVLGVFLFCWVPFFTVNIIDAICIRYDLQNHAACAKNEAWLYSFFVWLGYINSFLNPIIYTIFNPEFRKAFKKILSERCK